MSSHPIPQKYSWEWKKKNIQRDILTLSCLFSLQVRLQDLKFSLFMSKYTYLFF